tara:strand:+ start:72 stop:365 length:294 start_codon:yes stop_codon:yes gene_type:complete
LLYIITTILFVILAIFFAIISFYALRRINEYENIILNINNTIESINRQLKLIDDKGHFEADDEVGFFFDELKQLGKQLEELFETEEVDDDTQEKKEK